MYSSILVLALAGLTTAQARTVPVSWEASYTEAKHTSETQKKPLAVFVGSGSSGWNQVARDGGLGMDARNLLTEQFVCLYVNTATEQGKQLAQVFDVADGTGLVLSDRTGGFVVFRQQGDLTNQELAKQLRKVGSNTRTSNYPPEGSIAAAAGVATSSILNSNCPTCNGGGAVSTTMVATPTRGRSSRR